MARFKPPLCGFSCAEISGKEAFAPMNDTFMKTKPVFPLLVSMALPNVISMLVNSLYNIVDSLFVAQINEQAMTALSLVFPIQNFVNAVAIGFGVGINALVALYRGAGDHDRADAAATHGMALSVLHGILCTLAATTIMPGFLARFTADGTIVSMGVTYSTIVFLFATVNMASLAFEKLFQAVGRMKLTMIALISGCVCNILLDPVLIFGLGPVPALGIAGAAWATVIAQAASFCMSVLFFTRFSCQQFRGVRANCATVGRILTLGLPTLVQMGSLSVVLVVMNGLLAPRAGTVGVAAFGYVSRLAEFALAPFSALCLAAAPIIGSSYGAGLHSRVRQTVVRTVQLGLVYAVVAVAVCYALSGALLGIFTRDPAIVQFGTHCLRRLAPALLFLPPVLTVSAYFQSVNRAKSALVTAGALPLCLCVGACLAAPLGTGAVWWAVPIAAAVCAVFCGALYARQAGKRKRRVL